VDGHFGVSDPHSHLASDTADTLDFDFITQVAKLALAERFHGHEHAEFIRPHCASNDTIVYTTPGSGSWRVPVADLRVIGEFTDESGRC